MKGTVMARPDQLGGYQQLQNYIVLYMTRRIVQGKVLPVNECEVILKKPHSSTTMRAIYAAIPLDLLRVASPIQASKSTIVQ